MVRQAQAWIPELKMYYYKARIYSPTLGRFLQTDPIGYEDQINLYAYVANDPVNNTDPTGMEVYKLELDGTVVVILGGQVKIGGQLDTETGEIGVSLEGGIRFGLDMGIGLGGDQDPSISDYAQNNVSGEVAVDG